VSRSGIYWALKRLDISYNHPKADAEKRTLFNHKTNDYRANGTDIVYLDESGFAHDMSPTHGYAPIGERCYGTHDWGAYGRTNAIGALLGSNLLTLNLFEQSINAPTFDCKRLL
jgi:hypothetical protein